MGIQTASQALTNENANFSYRNRIINGAMEVNQKGVSSANANTTFDGSGTDNVYDRWVSLADGGTGSGYFTMSTSTDAPVGFNSSLLVTIPSSNTTLAGSDGFGVRQVIEGLMTPDLAWGTSDAKAITVSFWVKCSTTGTLPFITEINAYNSSGTGSNFYNYGTSYTINQANTWEKKVITIPGHTDSTKVPVANTQGGVCICFGLGAYTGGGRHTQGGSTWRAGTGYRYGGVEGTLRLINTPNATLKITGVQLEVNPTATNFERRPYGLELSLCRRYFAVFPPRSGGPLLWTTSFYSGIAYANAIVPFPMRAIPVATDPANRSSTLSSGAGNLYSTDGNSTNARTSSGSQPTASVTGTADSPVVYLSWSGASTPTSISNNFAACSFNGGLPGIYLNSEL